MSTYEDFTTYTEYDPADNIDVYEQMVTGVFDWSQKSYVYKDFEAGYFGATFIHHCNVKLITHTQDAAAWVIANNVADIYYLAKYGLRHIYVGWLEWGGRLILCEKWGQFGGDRVLSYVALPTSTWYYLVIERANGIMTCDVFTNPNRRCEYHVARLAISLNDSAATYRYLFAGCSSSPGGIGRGQCDQRIAAFKLEGEEAVEPCPPPRSSGKARVFYG